MNLAKLTNEKNSGYAVMENIGEEDIFFKGARIMPGNQFLVYSCDIPEFENVLAFSKVVEVKRGSYE